ncbi:SAM-dependent methyltransferase [Polycladomyces abyssicola]|uniref:SAM-dependent methyltransferase n=1 Tax=Polycladomyces abyssicola TaxID=1125966 RepID=A0A8D5UG37_9BACL|nr:class I SAM-dependent methyltransferase [Polycladomyces abyssicola]BCU82459.1 SAM-dependent methyltransferase [Polycladomyces abyssicola]
MNRADLIKKFDKQARWYEKRRIQQAQKEWRQKLLYFARGNVLEVAVGAGANFSFYPPGVRITAVDFSPEMLKRARNAADEYGIEVEFIQSDVETLTFPPDSFDTVVSTLSLCGYEDPVGVLNRFSRWCRNDGLILLMEHGLSSNPFLSFLQKALDPLAYRLVGCHQNRDMMNLIRSSDLVVEKVESHWAGVVHLVWAKPRK